MPFPVSSVIYMRFVIGKQWDRKRKVLYMGSPIAPFYNNIAHYYKSHRCVRMRIDEINNNEESFFRGK